LELTATSLCPRWTSANERGDSPERGFSLIELLVAMVVLAVGLLAGLGMIIAAIASNGGPKTNTAAATLAESTLERIVAVPLSPTGVSSPTSLNDCAGNNFAINTAPGGSPLVTTTWGISADFQQPAVPGYSMLYVNCTSGQGLTYDIRWTIEAGPTPSTQLVTVSARALGTNTGPSAPFVRPVTLRTLRGGP
jgi:prepilin-type N-terminal cleavage/methylation domain-containing protein